MSTISKMETPTGQEEAAILLEEYEKRIATLQVELDREKRKNEDLYRGFKGANDLYLGENLRAEKVQDALLQIRHLAWKNSFLSGRKRLRNLLTGVFSIAHNALQTVNNTTDKKPYLIDNATDKQLEGMTKLDKALQNIAITKHVLVENSCPSEFGLEDCENNPETGCSLCCEDCWNEEVEGDDQA